MELSQSASISLTTSLDTRLTQAQRVHLAQRIIQVRLEIVEAVWGAKYSPRAKCPAGAGCGRELTAFEILQGFRDDPTDYTTACPGCGYRFQPILRTTFSTGSAEIPFYCALQTLEGLRGKESLSYDDLNKKHASLLHSASVHFGNISAAFEKIGCDYPLDVNLAWKEKVRPFLGKVPDTVIAEIVGTSRSSVRRLRVKHGIDVYRARDWVD